MIFQLLVLFQVKHVFADYFLQTEYMLQKGKKQSWFYPLLSHALMHGFLTLAICQSYRPEMSWLALVDAIVHFAIDRVKAVSSRELPPSEKRFWWYLGIDQGCHHLTHYFLIWAIVERIHL